MAFHLGSLGFLTPFKFDTYQSQVTQIIEGTECSPTCQSSYSIHIPPLFAKAHGVPQFFICKRNWYMCFLHAGNAAIVLRSRLKVRVLKENWEKKAIVDEKGIILTNGDIESSWKAVQYQVTPAT